MIEESKKLNYVDADGNVYILGEFDESISSDVVAPLVKKINELEEAASTKNNTITFYINSRGGYSSELQNLLALIDIAKQKGIKIKTVILGEASSCASLLAIHGDHRAIYKNGFHYMHLGEVYGSVRTFKQLDRSFNYTTFHFNNIIKMYVDNTKLSESEVREMLNDDQAWLNAE